MTVKNGNKKLKIGDVQVPLSLSLPVLMKQRLLLNMQLNIMSVLKSIRARRNLSGSLFAS
jgi:hypothetical protein